MENIPNSPASVQSSVSDPAPPPVLKVTFSNQPKRGFLSLVSFACMLYLASAVCAIVGASQIVVPIHDLPHASLERFRCLIALNGYEMLLLAAAVTIVVWKKAFEDAVSLALLVVCFMVGSAAALNVIAPDSPNAAIAFGMAGALLAIGKLVTMQKKLLGDWGGPRAAALGVLIAWNFSAPAIFAHQLIPGDYTEFINATLRLTWHASWFPLIIASGVLLWGMSRMDVPAPEAEDTPVLRMQAMRWILAIVALAASYIHIFGVNWAFGLSGDGLPSLLDARAGILGVATLVLLVIELRRHMRIGLNDLDKVLAFTPWMLVLLLALAGRIPSTEVWWPTHPPISLLLMAAGLLGIGWRKERRALLVFAAASAALGAVILAWPLLRTLSLLHVAGALITASAVALWWMAIMRKDLRFAAAALVPTMILTYRLMVGHTGWATLILSVLLLSLGFVSSVRKAPAGRHSA